MTGPVAPQPAAAPTPAGARSAQAQRAGGTDADFAAELATEQARGTGRDRKRGDAREEAEAAVPVAAAAREPGGSWWLAGRSAEEARGRDPAGGRLQPGSGIPAAEETMQEGRGRASALPEISVTVRRVPAGPQPGFAPDRLAWLAGALSGEAGSLPPGFASAPSAAAPPETGPALAARIAEGLRAMPPAADPAHVPVTALRVQLQPAELGTVTAMLQFRGDRLQVEIRVETAEAYRRLAADRETILRTLQGLGFEVDRLVVQQSASGQQVQNGKDGTSFGEAWNGAGREMPAEGEERRRAAGEEGKTQAQHAGPEAEQRPSATAGPGRYI